MYSVECKKLFTLLHKILRHAAYVKSLVQRVHWSHVLSYPALCIFYNKNILLPQRKAGITKAANTESRYTLAHPNNMQNDHLGYARVKGNKEAKTMWPSHQG